MNIITIRRAQEINKLYDETPRCPPVGAYTKRLFIGPMRSGPSGVATAYSNSNLNFRLQLKYFLNGKMGTVERMFFLGILESDFRRG